MADRAAADEWIARVLGLRPADAATAASVRRAGEARAANTRGIAYPKLLLRWREAQGAAAGALARMGQAYLALPNVKADPRYAQVEQAVARLPALLPEFGEELGDLLDRGINAGTDSGIAKDALGVVGRYRSAIAGAAPLRALESFAGKYVSELAVVSTLDGALAEIAANLENAAPA